MKRFAILVLLAGCTLQNLTPTARMQESVYHLNDAARWNQLEAAAKLVSPKYQAQFRERRATWGETINVAEVDLLFMQLAQDKESAVSEISLSWTDATGVHLHRSNVTQKWANESGSFRLVDETINKGDQALFATQGP
ncbi:MAG TPA: hypothetical protein VFX59_19720 [Polyangiales bacterium]|nr:hypothetical protein [Polyangiales bacterium]